MTVYSSAVFPMLKRAQLKQGTKRCRNKDGSAKWTKFAKSLARDKAGSKKGKFCVLVIDQETSLVDIAHVGLTARHGRIWCHPLKPCALTKLPPMINELDARSRNSIHEPHRHLHHSHRKKHHSFWLWKVQTVVM